MLPKNSDKLIIQMTQGEAENIGLVFCKCGHPSNNHFEWGASPCAHCLCKSYKQVLKYGFVMNLTLKIRKRRTHV